MFMCDRKTASPVANRAERCGMVWKHVKTGGNKWKRVETSIRMGTVKVGKSCSRTPRKPESGGESAGNRWKGVETTIRMGTVKIGRASCREGVYGAGDGEGVKDGKKTRVRTRRGQA